jgi:very-short-patch-repair endonuclease
VLGDYQKAIDSKIDYLSKFASYVGKVNTEESHKNIQQIEFGPEYPPVAKPELVSDWERSFYRVLYESGFRPIPQFDEPPYILDFALFKGERKLDIEIDGEHYHRNWNGELCRRDQIRTQRLIEYGWDVMRFWVYEIRDDTDNCVLRVRKWFES